MAVVQLPDPEFLRECFRYDPDSGRLWWRNRPEGHFASPGIAKAWNSRHAGREAFLSVDPDGYLRCELNTLERRYQLRAHRVAFAIMTDAHPEMVDHENRVRSDTRFSNLRAADRVDNARNCVGKRDKTLPKGVHADRRKFVASMSVAGRKVRIGSYNCSTAAYLAYCKSAKALHGEFFNPG